MLWNISQVVFSNCGLFFLCGHYRSIFFWEISSTFWMHPPFWIKFSQVSLIVYGKEQSNSYINTTLPLQKKMCTLTLLYCCDQSCSMVELCQSTIGYMTMKCLAFFPPAQLPKWFIRFKKCDWPTSDVIVFILHLVNKYHLRWCIPSC